MNKLMPVNPRSNAQKFNERQVRDYIADELVEPNGTFLERGARTMSRDYDQASVILKEAREQFDGNLESLQAAVAKTTEAVKKASGNMKNAVEQLGQAMQRFDKIANFQNLERYVLYLERAAQAMTTLADLEKDGKLAKISNALK